MDSRKASVFKTKDLALIAMMSAVIVICSWISIPMTVPFTMQTFGIFTSLLLLGGKRGTVSIALYIFLGMVGLPVFSGFQGGIGHIIGPTGGYLIGFLFTGLLYASGERFAARRGRILLLAAGLLLCYLLGTLWFAAVSADGKSLGSVAAVCVVPYILPDLVKLLLAWHISKKIKILRII